jgi:hypothetical protein
LLGLEKVAVASEDYMTFRLEDIKVLETSFFWPEPLGGSRLLERSSGEILAETE